jgi:hypothetical protein
MQYLFKEPTYRRFPYERILAQRELAALIGRSPGWQGEALRISVRNPIPENALRRLAFVSEVEAPAGIIRTHTHLLEQSALRVRNGTAGSSSRKESTYLTHGLHRFKGKFYPQLCRSLLNMAGVDSGDLVLDPFMGSGTTLVECAISGIDSIGFDLNPLAQLIASTKLALLKTPPDVLSSALRGFEKALISECRRERLSWRGFASAEPVGSQVFRPATLAEECGISEATREISRWFPAAVCQKLALINRASKRIQSEVFRKLVRVCLSDQIRSVSQQDPRDLRIRRRSQEIDDAPLLSLLSVKLLREVEKLRWGMEILGDSTQVAFSSAELRDARTVERSRHSILSGRRVDAVVTSPPYANALPYIDTDRLSLLILGLLSSRERNQLQRQIIGNREIHGSDRHALESEMLGVDGLRTFPVGVANQIRRIRNENARYSVGFRRRNIPALLYQYFRDMRMVMARLHRIVRPGGRAFLVLGNSTTTLGNGEENVITTTRHVAAMAEQVGWTVADHVPISVTGEDLAHARNAITENQILLLKRSKSA